MNFDADYGRMYEELASSTIPGYDHLFLMVRGLLEARLPDAAEILVVGAGGGKELVTLADGSAWSFVGVDPSAQMIAFAQHKVEQADYGDRVRLQLGYAHDLPNEARFDAATCILVLHFIAGDDAKLALLRDISARLKSGATLVLVNLYGEDFDPDIVTAWRVFQRARGRTIEAIDAQEARARATTQFVSEPRLMELLDAAGFEQIQRFYTALWFGGWIARKK